MVTIRGAYVIKIPEQVQLCAGRSGYPGRCAERSKASHREGSGIYQFKLSYIVRLGSRHMTHIPTWQAHVHTCNTHVYADTIYTYMTQCTRTRTCAGLQDEHCTLTPSDTHFFSQTFLCQVCTVPSAGQRLTAYLVLVSHQLIFYVICRYTSWRLVRCGQRGVRY